MNTVSSLLKTTLTCATLLAANAAFGGLTISTFGSAVNIDFTGFDGSGFAPTPAAGQLDSDIWRVTGLSDGNSTFGGTYTTAGDFAKGLSTGGETEGGIYAFDVGGGNITLGVQPIGADFTPGTFTLKLSNDTGSIISAFDVSYDIYVYNDQERANSFNFAHSSDDTTYSAISMLDFTSPEAADGSPSWVSAARSTTITGISIPAGGSFFLRWSGDDVGGSGSRDEFGLDNISITAVPEPSSILPFAGFLIGLAFMRRRRG